MIEGIRIRLLIVGAVAALFGSTSEAQACWCSRIFSSAYYDPYVSYPVVARSYYAPVAACPTACPTVCPTTSCRTTNVERCYLEPQTTYATQRVLEPQVSYVRRSYYDPVTCCYRTYLEPATQYVERSYQVPVTSYVRRCVTEPVTSCTTSATIVGSSYYAPSTLISSYWSPDGIVYYPVATPSYVIRSDCPAPASNGTEADSGTERRGGYGPTPDGQQNGSSRESGQAPAPRPVPMPAPEKKNGTNGQGANAIRSRATRVGTGFLSPRSNRGIVVSSDGWRAAQTMR